MKKTLLMLLTIVGCSTTTQDNRLSDGSFSSDSEVAQRFLQNVTNTSLFFSTGAVVSVVEGTINIPGDAVYTLDSVLDENRAYFTRPVPLPDGTVFSGFSGLILSNNTLYFAAKREIIRPDSDKVTILLSESKANVDLTKIGSNTDGSFQIIATPEEKK